MKLSARNQFPGTILDVQKGATTTHVRIEITAGIVFRETLRSDNPSTNAVTTSV